jgi:hypothetical protein
LPTAKHSVSEVQWTPPSALFAAPKGFGLVTIDQEVPFQRSMSVYVFFEPTATHDEVAVHAIDDRIGAPTVGFGLATITHDVPSQRSTSVRAVVAFWE